MTRSDFLSFFSEVVGFSDTIFFKYSSSVETKRLCQFSFAFSEPMVELVESFLTIIPKNFAVILFFPELMLLE